MNQTKKLLVLLGLALAACRADNRSSVSIQGRPPPSSATACTYTPGTVFELAPGVLDVADVYANSGFLRYQLPIQLTNELADPVDSASTGVSAAKSWYPTAARVRVNPTSYTKDFRPNPPLLDYQAENTLPMNGAAVPVGGESVQWVSAISGPLGAQLKARVVPGATSTIVLGISLHGKTADGSELDTGEWYYPVQVCNGCLSCTNCTGTPPALCPDGTVTVPGDCGGPGQDSPTMCIAPTAG